MTRRTAAGSKPTSSALSTAPPASSTRPRRCRRPLPGRPRPDRRGCTTPGPPGRRPGPGHARRDPGPGVPPACHLDRGNPHVVGHQHRPGPDTGRTGRWDGGRRGPKSARQPSEGMASDLGQCTVLPAGKWSVEKGRHAQGGAHPAGECVAEGRRRRGHSGADRPGIGDERHHIEDAQARMGPLVRAEIERGDARPGQRPAPWTTGSAWPARVKTDRWWSGSRWRSSRTCPAAAANRPRKSWSRPSLTLTTHSMVTAPEPGHFVRKERGRPRGSSGRKR